MTEQMKAATIRALYGAIFTSGAVFFSVLQVTSGTYGHRFETAGIALGVAFSGYMLSRGITEGLIDSNREPTKADVGQ
jgi:hypothetical protein